MIVFDLVTLGQAERTGVLFGLVGGAVGGAVGGDCFYPFRTTVTFSCST